MNIQGDARHVTYTGEVSVDRRSFDMVEFLLRALPRCVGSSLLVGSALGVSSSFISAFLDGASGSLLAVGIFTGLSVGTIAGLIIGIINALLLFVAVRWIKLTHLMQSLAVFFSTAATCLLGVLVMFGDIGILREENPLSIVKLIASILIGILGLLVSWPLSYWAFRVGDPQAIYGPHESNPEDKN